MISLTFKTFSLILWMILIYFLNGEKQWLEEGIVVVERLEKTLDI